MTNATMEEMGSCGVQQGLACVSAMGWTVAWCMAAVTSDVCSVIKCVSSAIGSAGCCYPCVCYVVSYIMGSSCSSCSDILYENREDVLGVTELRSY